jgi:RNA polymerase sigma-70 factor (ECF subfamily)
VETQGLALMMAGCTPSSTEEFSRLLRLARAGDMAAFEQIIIHHERHVLLTALRLLGRLEDAQDAAQEVFIRLYKYLHRFDEKREFLPWLYRMTVNVCRDISRKQPRAGLLSLEEIPDPPVVAADLALEEERRMLAQGIKTLAEKERAALVLRDIEGLSTREVAAILGSSEATVRSQVSTARSKIKKFIDKRHL